MFSQLSVKVTSKLSPFGTAALASLANPISGINNGVGSSVVPPSPGAPGLSSDGSAPLSESSIAVTPGIGSPFSSRALPATVTVFSRTPVAAAASISTLNSKIKDSPTGNSEGTAVLTISVAEPPLKLAESSVTEPVAGGVVSVRP